MDNDSFSYTPLESSEDIRLVVIEPGERDSPLLCRLITARFDEDPVYEALSYVWGPTDHPGCVILDGQAKSITSNLWSALTHLREYDQRHRQGDQDFKPRCLWIDAICINQDDVLERNHQVQHMSRIYSRAATVLVWLGPAYDGSDLAMNALRNKNALKAQKGWSVPLIKLLDREYWKRM
jgi:hypothetical protein